MTQGRKNRPCGPSSTAHYSVYWAVSSLVKLTCLTPSCLRRRTGEYQDPGRWGKREAMPIASLSPAEWFCIQMGSDESHFNVLFSVKCKVTKTFHNPELLKREERAEEESNRGPACQPNALPLGQTGSHSLWKSGLPFRVVPLKSARFLTFVPLS